MQVVYERCAGLDVHKKSVVACRVVPDETGHWTHTIRTFGTMTTDLLGLADWLRAGEVTHVAMESTGVYWRPIFNILESEFTVMVVNAQHIKQVPGRKTDVKDAQWIAELLQNGLLKPSFIPVVAQRDLRELTRYRRHLIQEHTQEANRVHKLLEDANIKLGNVATDILGVSGRTMLEALIEGNTDSEGLAQLAKGRLRLKLESLEQALTGHLRDSHRFLLRMLLDHLDELAERISALNAEIDRLMDTFDPTGQLRERLDAIPGVGKRTIEEVIAEIGTDMARFPSANHLASWAGLAPGKNESAGRNRSARAPKGNRYVCAALVEAAQAAGHSRNTYLGAQFGRLAGRRGKKRAAVAVAHSILIIMYHMIRDQTAYLERGGDYFDQRRGPAMQKHLVKRLERLGFKVTLEPFESLVA